MSLKSFKTYQLAKQFYQQSLNLHLPRHLKDQLLRASSSVCLNLAEGSGKQLGKEQRRFYFIAFGSLRECQAILDLTSESNPKLVTLADQLGAYCYRLCYPKIKSE